MPAASSFAPDGTTIAQHPSANIWMSRTPAMSACTHQRGPNDCRGGRPPPPRGGGLRPARLRMAAPPRRRRSGGGGGARHGCVAPRRCRHRPACACLLSQDEGGGAVTEAPTAPRRAAVDAGLPPSPPPPSPGVARTRAPRQGPSPDSQRLVPPVVYECIAPPPSSWLR